MCCNNTSVTNPTHCIGQKITESDEIKLLEKFSVSDLCHLDYMLGVWFNSNQFEYLLNTERYKAIANEIALQMIENTPKNLEDISAFVDYIYSIYLKDTDPLSATIDSIINKVIPDCIIKLRHTNSKLVRPNLVLFRELLRKYKLKLNSDTTTRLSIVVSVIDEYNLLNTNTESLQSIVGSL